MTIRYYFVWRIDIFHLLICKSFWLISKLQLGELLMMYETLSFNCHHDSILKRLSISTLSSHRRVRGWRRARPRTGTRSCPRCAGSILSDYEPLCGPSIQALPGSPPWGSRTAPPSPPPSPPAPARSGCRHQPSWVIGQSNLWYENAQCSIWKERTFKWRV